MPVFPLSEALSTFKDLTSKALRVVSESKITGGYSPAVTTMQNAVGANGNGTNLDVNEYATAVLEVRGTFGATINFEQSADDTNWYPILATKHDGTTGSTTTTTGLYEVKTSAIKSVRARVSGYASGSVTVVGKVSPLVNSEKTMQLSGSNAYQSGNPYPIAKDCVAANTNYDIDVNAGLARNGHFGLIQAHETNTGVVSVWISFDGATFTASAIARLQAGDALSLDGLDIDTIRVQSTIAGDDVLGGVW